MDVLLAPVVEHGFLGLCGVQLVVGVWLVRRLIDLAQLMSQNAALQAASLRAAEQRLGEIVVFLGDLRDRMLQRPCLRTKAKDIE